jgi:hypothetical protein
VPTGDAVSEKMLGEAPVIQDERGVRLAKEGGD